MKTKNKLKYFGIFTLCAVLMIGCLSGCKKDKSDKNETTEHNELLVETENNSESVNTEQTENPNIEVIIPEGPTETNATEENSTGNENPAHLKDIPAAGLLVYDKNNVKIKYFTEDMHNGANDKFTFDVQNLSTKDIRFGISSVVINGTSINGLMAQDDSTIVKPNESKFVDVQIKMGDRVDVCETGFDISCLSFVGYLVENPESNKKVLDDNIFIDITESGHNHKNDKRIIKGEKVYSGEDIDVYINKTSVGDSSFNNFEYTIINKTNKNIFANLGFVTYRSTTSTGIDNHSYCLGVNRYLAGNTFATGKFRMDNTKFEDITVADIKLECFEGTCSTELYNGTKLESKDNDQVIHIKFNIES